MPPKCPFCDLHHVSFVCGSASYEEPSFHPRYATKPSQEPPRDLNALASRFDPKGHPDDSHSDALDEQISTLEKKLLGTRIFERYLIVQAQINAYKEALRLYHS